MKTTFLSIIAFAAICITAPLQTQAYYTTNQEVHRINNNTAFYTITYSFSNKEDDLYLPLFAERTQENNISSDTAGYTFTTSEGGNVTAGESAALVFSDAPIVNNMYKVAGGTRSTFSLIVILKLEESDPRAKYGLQVTNLPFRVDTGIKLEEQGLNVHELGAYHTKEIGLNK